MSIWHQRARAEEGSVVDLLVRNRAYKAALLDVP